MLVHELEILKNIPIDKTLNTYINDKINNTEDNLEKLITIYNELCNIFEYDDEYIRQGQYEETNSHTKIENISQLNFLNNKVVCYDVTMLLYLFLIKNDIECSIITEDFKETLNYKYGHYHPILKIKIDGVYYIADMLESVVDSDLVNSKLGIPLTGLKASKQEKNEKIKSFLSSFQEQKIKKFQAEKIEILMAGERDIYGKVNKLNQIIKQKQLSPIELSGYLNKIIPILKVFCEIDKKLIVNNEKQNLTLVLITKENNKKTYYLYDEILIPLTEQEFMNMQSEKKLQYLENKRKNLH